MCSVPAFNQVFYNKSTKYMYQDATGSSPMSSMSSPQVLAKIKETSRVAVSIYDNFNLGKKWNLPGKEHGVNAVVVTKCDNCGEKDHLANKCPQPRDDERCKAARDARAKAKEDSGGRGGGGRGGGGCGGRGGRGAGGRGNSDERAPWKETEGSNSGVKMIDGAWQMLVIRDVVGIHCIPQGFIMSRVGWQRTLSCHLTTCGGAYLESSGPLCWGFYGRFGGTSIGAFPQDPAGSW